MIIRSLILLITQLIRQVPTFASQNKCVVSARAFSAPPLGMLTDEKNTQALTNLHTDNEGTSYNKHGSMGRISRKNRSVKWCKGVCSGYADMARAFGFICRHDQLCAN
jgi:hypothetical protein